MAPTKQDTPRPEHPRPQFRRTDWRTLNGPWTFVFDPGRSGAERGLASSQGFEREIIVPFCPESTLSGVGHTDFVEALWYHRTIEIPSEWDGKLVLLHFGAVDYGAEVFVDGQLAGRHTGGSVSFHVDITRFVKPGSRHHLVVHARDFTRSGAQPVGKQSTAYGSAGCHYTRTTGIWQTVWLEAVSPRGLAGVQIVPDLDGSRFVVIPTFHSVKTVTSLRVRVMDGDTEAGETRAAAVDGVPVAVTVPDVKKWSPQSPFLYGIALEVVDSDGTVLDTVSSYAGMRTVSVEGNRVLLNDEPVYLRLVLDQGFYPDGIWTAPSDDALRRDIELSMQAGFNGARLHQKVFEERFHYWADKLGYLTWGESASWGVDIESDAGARNFLTEWREIVVRDRNHPSIIAWTPFNETHPRDRALHDRTVIDAYELTRSLDPTRPVNDTSGYFHQRTDLWTVHVYQQDPAALADKLRRSDNAVFRNHPDAECPYNGQPYIVDEFGGIKWIPEDRRPFADNSWGYGDAPKTQEQFYERLAGLVRAIRDREHVCGYCYTQLTDVEQEQNGVYNYDRSAKFDMGRIREIFGATPGART